MSAPPEAEAALRETMCAVARIRRDGSWSSTLEVARGVRTALEAVTGTLPNAVAILVNAVEAKAAEIGADPRIMLGQVLLVTLDAPGNQGPNMATKMAETAKVLSALAELGDALETEPACTEGRFLTLEAESDDG